MPSASRLGRVPSPPDPHDHPLSRYLNVREASRERPDYYAPVRLGLPVYDQVGPSCVGNGSALSATIDQRRDHFRTIVYDGEEFYRLCKQEDGYPGDGTYPRVGMKIRQARGLLIRASPRRPSEVGTRDVIAAYAALQSVEDIVVATWTYGSAGIGSTWYFEWDIVPSDGVLPPGVTPAGGHWYTVVGYDLRGSRRPRSLLCQNSWSDKYGRRIAGVGGRFWLPTDLVDFDDFEAWRTVDLQDD